MNSAAAPVHNTGYWVLPRPGFTLLHVLIAMIATGAMLGVGAYFASRKFDLTFNQAMWAAIGVWAVLGQVIARVAYIRAGRHHQKIAPVISARFGITVDAKDLYNLQRAKSVRLISDPTFTLCKVEGPGDAPGYGNMVGVVGPWGWVPPTAVGSDLT